MKNPPASADASELQNLRVSEVRLIRGQSLSTTYREVNDGLLTKPTAQGPNRKAWPRYEIETINRARLAGLDDEAIRKIVAALMAARRDLAKRSSFEIRKFVTTLLEQQIAEAA